jgi:hypothetical protein
VPGLVEGVVVAGLVADVVVVVERVRGEKAIVRAELRHRLQQRLGERAGAVIQLIGPDELIVELDLDPAQQVGSDFLEAIPRVDLHVGAPWLAALTVADESDRVAALGAAVSCSPLSR